MARSKRTKKNPKKPEELTDADRAAGLGRWFGVIFLVLLVTTGGVLLGAYPRSAGPGDGTRVEIDIHDTSAGALAETLKNAGLIDNANAFTWYVRLTGGAGSVVKGHHLLTDDASPRELMHRLQRRNASPAKVL